MTTLREMTKQALAKKAAADREKTAKEVETILGFCSVYAERGDTSAQYDLYVSPAARKVLEEGPEQLKFQDRGEGVADSWLISWNLEAESLPEDWTILPSGAYYKSTLHAFIGSSGTLQPTSHCQSIPLKIVRAMLADPSLP